MGQPAFVSSLPLPDALAPRARSEARESGFAAVDRLARTPASAGLVFVQATASSLAPLARHLERRLRATGRDLLSIAGMASDDAWRELSTRLGALTSADPLVVAREIAHRAGDAALVLIESAPTQWGGAVADELARLVGDRGHGPLILALREGAVSAGLFGRTDGLAAFAVDASLAAGDADLWWDAMARDAGERSPDLERLDTLDGWWSVARTTSGAARPAPPVPGEAAARLWSRLTLSQRSWPSAEAGRLGSNDALNELLALGVVALDRGGRVECRLLAGDATPDDARVVAAALVTATGGADEAWSSMRAAELHAQSGAAIEAEAALFRAIALVTDADARADFWQRWERALAAMTASDATSVDATARLLRSAELALRVGDVDRSLDLARAAAARGGDSYDIMLTLGRATTARGDLTTASIALAKAMERAPDAELRARAGVEMAELCYAAGQLDDARRHADAALAVASGLGTRLSARNVLGKLLLASAAWDDAERHFAADACEATCGADFLSELRARLNRAIALLSSGRRDEAWGMLVSVLEDGERRGELRASAMAVANLATIATVRHEYPRALELWTRSIDAMRRLGDKLRLARLITNLAELRLGLGLVAEADQALVFGRKACGPGMPAARFAHFSVVAARIHLARGRTLEASTEIDAAIAGAGQSSHGSMLGDCHLVAARIALEDGDLVRAERSLVTAELRVNEANGRAELALLRAMLARAAGQDFDGVAREALELSRDAQEDELSRDAHLLVHLADAARGDARSARFHLAAAVMLRDKVSGALSDELRASYLARRDLAELARLEQEAQVPVEPTSSVGCARCGSSLCAGCERPRGGASRAAPEASLRRIVGHAPAMVSLASAIKKIGRTDATVLILGESGTGKELVAEALHEASDRRGAPLVKVNCAALVETLLLSELFGHEKGSFTGAAARRRGRFELAEGGTLFLDEIGDISPNTQVALLRVLQEKTYERVGGVTPLRANVRIVCATHRDIKAMVARGEFREDLYYRLRGLVLEVPALRQRITDLPVIAEAILQRVAAERRVPVLHLSPTAAVALSRHAWPGNVRELENALRAAALFAEGDALEIEDFTSNVDGLRELAVPAAPLTMRAGGGDPGCDDDDEDGSGTRPALEAPVSFAPSRNEPEMVQHVTDVAYASVRGGVSLFDMKRQIEHDCIARALVESGGNITRAATLLGMKRPRLSQLVKQYGLGNGAEES